MYNVKTKIPVFIETQMKRLMLSDVYLMFVFDDLRKKNPEIGELELLEILFNTYILDDGGMVEEYLAFA